jgi:hypothetical protein
MITWMDGMDVLEVGQTLHDWYTPSRQRQMPALFCECCEGFLSFVQWAGPDAWIGGGCRRSSSALCLYLECLNDTLKLMTWMMVSLLSLGGFAATSTA